MRSEILFIVVLIAPWALVLMAVLLYRRRRMRKGMDDSKVGWRDGGGHAG
jgi:purine-cytosine permease-like protein